jgi:hypothetical protein
VIVQVQTRVDEKFFKISWKLEEKWDGWRITENDLGELKMMRWRQRPIMEKSGKAFTD